MFSFSCAWVACRLLRVGHPHSTWSPCWPSPLPRCSFPPVGVSLSPLPFLVCWGWGFVCCLQSPIVAWAAPDWGWVLQIKFPAALSLSIGRLWPEVSHSPGLVRVGLAAAEPLLFLNPSLPVLSTVWVLFLPPCPLRISSIASSSSVYRAQFGRLGGSRWGWVLQIQYPCRTHQRSPCVLLGYKRFCL